MSNFYTVYFAFRNFIEFKKSKSHGFFKNISTIWACPPFKFLHLHVFASLRSWLHVLISYWL